jgi:hypothetical protein
MIIIQQITNFKNNEIYIICEPAINVAKLIFKKYILTTCFFSLGDATLWKK